MTPWSLYAELDRLPAEERDLMESALAYAGAYLRGAPGPEQRQLRRRWLRAFRRRWPERPWPLDEFTLRRVS